MNKYLSLLGLIFIFVSCFFFLADFNGGQVAGLVVTDGIPLVNYAALLFAIIFLPVGAGLAFVGFAYRSPPAFAASGSPGGGYASSNSVKAVLAVAIIAVLVSGITLAAVISVESSVGSLTGRTAIAGVTSTTTVSGNGTTVTVAGAGGGFNMTPSVVAFKVDWCNTENAGQDRFCPDSLTVIQGDIVQIMFISNDTDAHTFTLNAPYDFQINDSSAGMHNFLTNAFNSGDCTNTTSFASMSAAISGTYCVSGSALLPNSTLISHGANNFAVAQNPHPGSAFNGSNPSDTPVIVPIDDQVHFVNATSAAIASGSTEVWGIAAFQATQPGIYEFFCHYHVSNGMFGYLIVLPNSYCTSNPSACNSATTSSTTTT